MNCYLLIIRNAIELDGEITLNEITFAIKKCKKRKAPGLDGIFKKSSAGNWLMYLYIMFNKIIRDGKIPDSWTSIVAKMIHKKGDNYRQILKIIDKSHW